jgi:hypothetical protein
MAEEFAIRKEIALSATPEEVWEAIATEPGLAAWFIPFPIDPSSDLVTAWEPAQALATRTPPGPDGSTQAFEYLIVAKDGGSTVLRFVHRGFRDDDWSDEFEPMTGAGWDMYLYTLSQYLTHFAGRPATYVEAEGPASSAQPGCWSRLLGRLDPSGSIAEGSEVQVALPGLAPITGMVDYLTPHFVGLRTPDALIRFHGRWPIGMTVAVSHHAYAEGTDVAATSAAWSTWLAQTLA